MVGATGFEPATTRPPVWCATRLRYAPDNLRLANRSADRWQRLCDELSEPVVERPRAPRSTHRRPRPRRKSAIRETLARTSAICCRASWIRCKASPTCGGVHPRSHRRRLPSSGGARSTLPGAGNREALLRAASFRIRMKSGDVLADGTSVGRTGEFAGGASAKLSFPVAKHVWLDANELRLFRRCERTACSGRCRMSRSV